MYEELVKRLREESEIEQWLQPHSANETPKLLDDAAHAIEELSKERKTGKWEDKGHDNIYQCSVCGDLWMGIGGYRFCPNCGAKMNGGDDDV